VLSSPIATDLALAGGTIALLAPLLGSAGDALRLAASGSRFRWSPPAAVLGAAAALVAAGAVLAGSSASVVLRLPLGLDVGLALTPVTATLLVLVTGIGAVVQRFSVRYLRDDPTGVAFGVAAGAVLSGMADVALAAGLLQLLAGWLLASFAFRRAASLRRDLPGVDQATRRIRRATGASDLALVAAVALVLAGGGSPVLPAEAVHLPAHLGGLALPAGAALLAAAVLRGGTPPAGRWLSDAIAAPTPVSALLHAGVANGGALLLLRLLPLVDARSALALAAVVLGSAGAILAGALARARGDLKGHLAWSTSSQMSFVLVECALGLSALAVVHLVAHACYKADRFLRSSTLPGARTLPAGPTLRPGRLAAGALAGLAATAAALVAGGLRSTPGGEALVASVALGALGAGLVLAKRGTWSQTMGALSALVAFAAVTGGLAGALASALSSQPATTGLSPWLLLVPILGGGLLSAALWWPPARRRLLPIALDLAAPLDQRPGAPARPVEQPEQPERLLQGARSTS